MLVGGVLHIARLQQVLMFLSVYTVLPSPRTSVDYPLTALHPSHPAIHRAIHQGVRARPRTPSDAYDCAVVQRARKRAPAMPKGRARLIN